METVQCYNIYTGRFVEREVIRRTKTVIVLKREDWKTGEQRMILRPTNGRYWNDYAREVTAGK